MGEHTNIAGNCPYLNETITVPNIKVAGVLLTTFAFGYVCGVGLKKIIKNFKSSR